MARIVRLYGRRAVWGLAALALAAGACAPGAIAAPPFPMPGGGWMWGMPMGLQWSDQRFIVMMIPHHDSAIAMAELALRRARRPEIKALAQRIQISQSAENAQMRSWYRQWFGSDVPSLSLSGMGMGFGLGMSTSLEALRSAADFDRAFIEQMIPHHRMGVMMASHAQWNTQHPQLRQLEAEMVRVQSQEIDQMAQWYRQWYGSSPSSGR